MSKVCCYVCSKMVEEHYYQKSSDGVTRIVCNDCLNIYAPYTFWCESLEDYVSPSHGDCAPCDFYRECELAR